MKKIPKLYDMVKLKDDLDYIEHYNDRGYVKDRTGIVISEPMIDGENTEVYVEFSENVNINIEDLEVIENNTNLLQIYLINKSDVEQVSKKEIILFSNQIFNKKDLITNFKQTLSEEYSKCINHEDSVCGCHVILDTDRETGDDIVELFIEYLTEQGFSYYEKNEKHIPSIAFEIYEEKHIKPIFSDFFISYESFFIDDNKFIFSNVIFKDAILITFSEYGTLFREFDTVTVDLLTSKIICEKLENSEVENGIVFDLNLSNIIEQYQLIKHGIVNDYV